MFDAYNETQIPRAIPLKNSKKATKIPILAFCLMVMSTKFVQSVANKATKAARADAMSERTDPDLNRILLKEI